MSKNIEINIQTASNTYETLYPKTLGPNIDGAVSLATKATSADSLTNSRTIQTNLASTSSASFNGTSNITPGVSGVLPVGNGGTGTTSYSSLASTLSSYFSFGKIKTGYYKGNGGSTDATINFTSGYQYILLSGFNLTSDSSSSNYVLDDISVGTILIPLSYSTGNGYFTYAPLNSCISRGNSRTANDVAVGYIEIRYNLVANSSITIKKSTGFGFYFLGGNSQPQTGTKITGYDLLNLNNNYYFYAVLG